jgi:hypothetical protein
MAAFWGQKRKLTPVRPIPSVIQKEKSLTWKHLSKSGRTKVFILTAMKRARRQSDGNFVLVKIGFSSIKSPNSFRKSKFFFFGNHEISFLFIESKKRELILDRNVSEAARIFWEFLWILKKNWSLKSFVFGSFQKFQEYLEILRNF